MGSKAKVGSWLNKNEGEDVDEANESSDEGSSSGSMNGDDGAVTAAKMNGKVHLSEDEEDEVEQEKEEDIDWEQLLPKLRPAILDTSGKRKVAFISRYLTVTQNCKHSLVWGPAT